MAEALGGDTAHASAQPPFEENLQAGGPGSDEENMNNVRHLLVERMDPDFGLIDKLLQLGALTYPETGLIKSEKSIFDRNNKLLELIFSKKNHQALLTALTDTGQKHLFNLVKGNGGYRPEYGTVWPLRERETQILDANRFNLVDIIDPCDLITRMFSKSVISNRQHRYINGLPNNTDKAEALLDILRRGSEECYWKTVLCLQESNQSDVAEILVEGGVLAQVHVSNEGEAEQVNEEEDHILEAMEALLQNSTLPQYQRIRERLDLRIMRAKKGQSIVFYIYCKTLEELLYLYDFLSKEEFDKCIATVFDLLISKRETTVSAVNWSDEEFARFKKYFEVEADAFCSKLDRHREFLEERIDPDFGLLDRLRSNIGERMTTSSHESDREEEPMDIIENAEVEGDAFRSKLERHREFLEERMDPDFGLLDQLRSNKGITYGQNQNICAEKVSVRKSRMILDCILQGPGSDKIAKFRDALRETKQEHLVNYVYGDGEYRPQYGGNWPLGDAKVAILDDNSTFLTENIDSTHGLLACMIQKKAITQRQMESISAHPEPYKRNGVLLDIIRRGSQSEFEGTIEALKATNQESIAEVLILGGMVLSVRSRADSNLPEIDPAEEEIIRQIDEILGNKTPEEKRHLLETYMRASLNRDQVQEKRRLLFALQKQGAAAASAGSAGSGGASENYRDDLQQSSFDKN